MVKGQLVGYIRVSTEDQNTARQNEALAEFNLDKVFTDKASGKDTDRPQLQAALAHLREGDTFVIYSMDRLSRSLTDLINTAVFVNKVVRFSNRLSPLFLATPHARAAGSARPL
jgi:DNA invertase Pin-like site-specific DNA recombinase